MTLLKVICVQKQEKVVTEERKAQGVMIRSVVR